MSNLIEFVPNISEGRNQQIIDKITRAMSSCDGISLLNVSSDFDHNRTVFTIVGTYQPLLLCATDLYSTSIELIDMTKQTGIHPRIGAVDVAPFIPIGDTPMSECVSLANEVASLVAARFNLPVFLYAEAAKKRRVPLSEIRRGGFEHLVEKMATPDWKPDYGPGIPHPTAGATSIGARDFLVAYNIVIDTPDIKIAKSIAKSIRESSGGLPGVQAIGLLLNARNLAQVSINLLNYRKTSIPAVQKQVAIEAEKLGVQIVDSELIGLTPKDALSGHSADLKIANFHDGLILENALAKAGFS